MLAIPAPATAGGGGCAEVTAGSSTTVELISSCITPTLVRIEPGETITFVNRDDYRHVIAGAGYAWASEGSMRPEEAFTATFRTDGVYPFQCYLHPGMTGAVIVGDGTGLGAASRANVFVEPLAGTEEPTAKVVYLTKAVPAGSSTAGAWTAGIAIGIATGATVVVAGALVRRRGTRVEA